jgi:DNA-binding NarL/FixJ family response regulator
VSRVTRVLIADDQPAIRHGFRLMIEAQPDMSVVGEAADGETAVSLARRVSADVVLADVRMPRLDGLEVTRRLAGPGVTDPVRVIVVTTFDLDEYVHSALRHGACGFLLKRAGPVLLVEAIRAAMAGDVLVSPSVTVRLLRHLREPRPNQSAVPAARLTARELDVARLVAQGHTNAQIAAELFVSPGTVKTHVANIQRKLGVRNRVGIAAWAWDGGYMAG